MAKFMQIRKYLRGIKQYTKDNFGFPNGMTGAYKLFTFIQSCLGSRHYVGWFWQFFSVLENQNMPSEARGIEAGKLKTKKVGCRDENLIFDFFSHFRVCEIRYWE
jgi:hypothetical protein